MHFIHFQPVFFCGYDHATKFKGQKDVSDDVSDHDVVWIIWNAMPVFLASNSLSWTYLEGARRAE